MLLIKNIDKIAIFIKNILITSYLKQLLPIFAISIFSFNKFFHWSSNMNISINPVYRRLMCEYNIIFNKKRKQDNNKKESIPEYVFLDVSISMSRQVSNIVINCGSSQLISSSIFIVQQYFHETLLKIKYKLEKKNKKNGKIRYAVTLTRR